MDNQGESEHIVKSYEQELGRLKALLTQMGGMVEAQAANASRALVEHNSTAASYAVQDDLAVDRLEREITDFAIRMLALRQPMAADLRLIVSSMKIASDLERIGDYAANVAKRSLVLNEMAIPFSLSGVANMCRLVQENLKNTVDAVGEGNADRALEVWRSDIMIDDVYSAIFREQITYMMEDPRNITPCTHLLFMAKNLERMGDHATNIAETVYYAITGDIMPSDRPKGESSFTVNRHNGA
ncbi:phosphate signaling complex protein PhoU [Acidisoma cellulosilytica]|uniref:Phosphate-specific transport system accessory protein PhoU n=1 Tax=Acidisoma cellulosilyticum TaxID=2802395 RepID=A0A964E2T6_9PROT|nr:phosphate signaling complex protein PhoU [Acidisoma cellulosilyticum]MCB8879751.1 phosphate signaling complex protein PhoU [Acidisoma cellulosilyticum]